MYHTVLPPPQVEHVFYAHPTHVILSLTTPPPPLLPLAGNVIVMETPRLFLIQPLGSTCTVLFFLHLHYHVPIPKEVALCLLAGVVSDTLNLKGPTTTSDDVVCLVWVLYGACVYICCKRYVCVLQSCMYACMLCVCACVTPFE